MEILIQDLNTREEIKRFKEYNVMKCAQSNCKPIYFAPYFTRSSEEQEGITYFSKVLGSVSLSSARAESYRSTMLELSNYDVNVVDQWIEGINLDVHSSGVSSTKRATYLLLGAPTVLRFPLLKDTEIRGQWIFKSSPLESHYVSFAEFVERIKRSYMFNIVDWQI